jgi:hypothetical protein
VKPTYTSIKHSNNEVLLKNAPLSGTKDKNLLGRLAMSVMNGLFSELTW